MVEKYMEYFSGLVDFDVFRLTAVDCIFPYNYLHKVWFVVVFPSGCLVLLIFCHLIGRWMKSRALRLNDRIIDGESTGFGSWPPKKQSGKKQSANFSSTSGKRELVKHVTGIDERKQKKRKSGYKPNANRLSIAQVK